ncbi:MAG: zinc-ribbon domain-containing protein, partial [Gaiellaceae bacterium]
MRGFCEQCGAALSEGANFCAACGTKVTSTATPDEPSAADSPASEPATARRLPWPP